MMKEAKQKEMKMDWPKVLFVLLILVFLFGAIIAELSTINRHLNRMLEEPWIRKLDIQEVI